MSYNTKTKEVKDGDISFQELAESSFSFSVDEFVPEQKDKINVTLEEVKNDEDLNLDDAEIEEEEDTTDKENDVPVDTFKEKEKEKEDVVIGTGKSDSFYRGVAKKYLENGTWEDVELEQEDGQKVKLSEIEDLDEETFFEMQEVQKNFMKEELEKNYIPVDGLDENAKKIVEILKNGGDFFEIFKKPEDLKRPFEGIDLDNEQNQESILFQQYLRQGLAEDEAVDLVKRAKKELTIDTKVSQIVEHYQTSYDKMLTKKAEEQAAKKLEDDKKMKQFKKEVLDTFVNTYKIKDSLARKLTSLGAERTNEGDFKIDEIYSKKMEDPKEAAEIMFFLNDKEGYLKMMGANIKRESNLKTIRTVTRMKDKVKSTNKEEPENKSALSFNISEINN